MSKFTDIKESIKRMMEKRTKSDGELKNKENPSMLESEQPEIFGVRRSVVIGIVSMLIVIFISSIWYSLDSSGSSPSTMQQPTSELTKPSKQQDAGNQFGVNDYQALAEHEKKRRDAAIAQALREKNNHAQRAENEDGLSHESPRNADSVRVPRIQNNAQSYLPYMLPQTPQQSETAEAKEKAAAEKMKERYNAAIAFAIGKREENTQQPATGTASPAAPTSSGSAMYTAVTDVTLQAGTIIPAILMTGINSDVGGQVIAQIQTDVYDSLTGYKILIPSGSRLIGEYASGAANGQSRVGLKWNTLLLPNGGSWALGDSMVAVDGAGYAGVSGKVNNHTSKVLSAGAFTSAFAALASVAAGSTSQNSNTYTAGQLASQGAVSNLLNTASSLFEKNMNIQPTITIKPGYEFNVFVTKPISFQRKEGEHIGKRR